jgi:hypothetical protein
VHFNSSSVFRFFQGMTVIPWYGVVDESGMTVMAIAAWRYWTE